MGMKTLMAHEKGKGKKLKGKSAVDFFESVNLIFTFLLLPFAFAHADASSATVVSASGMPLSSLQASPNSAQAASAAKVVSPDMLLEEGKTLYENGQYLAALSKFMIVLRKNPQQPEARQYLRLVIEAMRKNPNAVANRASPTSQAAVPSALVQEEIRQRMRKRSLLTLDLKAIPGIVVNIKNNQAQVEVDASILFAEKASGLKEQGVPLLDRVAAWLQTFGQQPVIIHIYPEETQDPDANGGLFLHRYAQLYNFFVEERKLAPARFVSADLLGQEAGRPQDLPLDELTKQKSSTGTIVSGPSTPASRVVIETIGNHAAYLEVAGSDIPHVRWLELSILSSKSMFNPEEGEWASLDLAALTHPGLRSWSFQIVPAGSKGAAPVMALEGKENLLKRIGWNGIDQKTGSFVRSGAYVCRLVATDSDGNLQTRDMNLEVQRTVLETPLLVKKLDKSNGRGSSDKAKPKRKRKTKPVEPPPEQSDEPAQIPSRPKASPGGEANAPEATSDTDRAVPTIWKQVIQFDNNQGELKPTLKTSLERIGKTLEVYPLQKVRIMGFADASEDNAAQLARKRAETVRDTLVNEYQVDPKRVIVAGGKVSSGSGESGGPKVEMSITN